jgi:ABC-2 type transport system permease protein
MVTVVASTYFFGAVLGGWILSEPVPYAVFLQASVMVWLLGLSLATVTYAIGAATGRKGLAGLVVGFYAFVAYFIASLSTATDIVDKLSYGSLFRYVAAPEVIANGLNSGHVAVFVVVIIVSLVVALPIFARRDLKTR